MVKLLLLKNKIFLKIKKARFGPFLLTLSRFKSIIQYMKTPKTVFEFRYKIKVEGQKTKLVWGVKPFTKQNIVFNELVSKGFKHIGTYRINPKKYTSGFRKTKRFSKKVLTITIIRLPIKRRIIKKAN
jgi:hypothetical protein